MKIETRLVLSNIKKNKKRTLYTTISLILCITLLLTTIILISSIREGVSENFDSEYNDYHIVIKDLSVERFNTIKNKEYIEKIYIQKNENEQLEKVDSTYIPQENVTVYLKYKNIRKVCDYTEDIIRELKLSKEEVKNINDIFNLNKQLLTVYGLIDVYISDTNNQPYCAMRVNYSAIINIMIVIVISIFSILFIAIIYNAFLITINERTKEYAVLNSVGGTEGQILKMIFLEAIIMGIIGTIIGALISFLISNTILKNINQILYGTGYNFRLIFSAKYIALSIIIIAINIYISALIPSVKASTTSIIEEIRNNRQIKHKKNATLLEKILPIEGKVAIKNIKRSKTQYSLIIFLLIVCITSFITINTYINYEKEVADIVNEYDVDAEITFHLEEYNESNMDYKTILKNYEKKYNKKIEYIEYRQCDNNYFLVQPSSAFANESYAFIFENNNKAIKMNVIALDNATYKNYIDKLNGNNGDLIIYNNSMDLSKTDFINSKYTYSPIFKKNIDMTLCLIKGSYDVEISEFKYKIVESNILNKNVILADEIVEGFKNIKTWPVPVLFMNMQTYNEISNYMEAVYGKYNVYINDGNPRSFWRNIDDLGIKIKCDDVVEFHTYMEKFNNKNGIYVEYYTLQNQEKIIYINIIRLMLKIIISAIVIIGVVSTINIINASLVERKQDFKILDSIGATTENIKKVLIYESIYMFIKAVVISIILSIPIIYMIIKKMGATIVLDKLLVPYGNITIFIVVLFLILLTITLFSVKIEI